MNASDPDAKVDLAGSQARLNEFLAIPKEVRTFPDCLVKPAPVEPLRAVPAAPGATSNAWRTRSKVLAGLDAQPARRVPPRASKSRVATRSSPSVRDFIDLTELNKAPAEKKGKGQDSGNSAAQSVPINEVPESPAQTSATKKRKTDVSEAREFELGKGTPDMGSAEMLVLGTEQVMKGPDYPHTIKAMNLNQSEMLRTGLGHLIQSLNLFTSATRTDDRMSYKLEELTSALDAEKLITAHASRKISDQQLRIQGLKDELERANLHLQSLAAANKRQMEQAEEQTASHQHDLKVAFKYGLIKALQAGPGIYDLEAEQAALEELEAGSIEEPEPAFDAMSLLNNEASAETGHPQQAPEKKADEAAESLNVVGDK